MLENKYNVSEGIVLKYISETYSRCWDESMFQNKIKLQCIVSCDTSSFHLLSKEILLLQHPIFQAHIGDDNDGWYSRNHSSSSSNNNNNNTSNFEQNNNSNNINQEATTNSLSINERIQRGLFSFNICYYTCPAYPTNLIYYLDSGDGSCNHATPSTVIGSQASYDSMIPSYSKVAIGGTFDKLHNGHRKLLTLAACKCRSELTIGVISDSLLTKKANSNLIESYSNRVEAIKEFFLLLKPSLKLNIVELHDPYGPTITDPTHEAIIVSSETISGAIEINRLRSEKNYNELQILIMKRSDISTLSSTYLRERQLREKND